MEARVVNVFSWGHHFSPFIFEDLNFINREYETFSAYGLSKSSSIIFSLKLDNRGKNVGVCYYSVKPGIIIETESNRYFKKKHFKILNYLMKTAM